MHTWIHRLSFGQTHLCLTQLHADLFRQTGLGGKVRSFVQPRRVWGDIGAVSPHPPKTRKPFEVSVSVDRFGGAGRAHEPSAASRSRSNCSACATIFASLAFRASSSAISKSFRASALRSSPALAATPVVVGYGVTRFQAHRLGAISDGVFVLSQQALGDTSVVVGYGVVRFQANRLGAVGDGVFVLPQRALGGTPVSVGLRVIWFQTNRSSS